MPQRKMNGAVQQWQLSTNLYSVEGGNWTRSKKLQRDSCNDISFIAQESL